MAQTVDLSLVVSGTDDTNNTSSPNGSLNASINGTSVSAFDTVKNITVANGVTQDIFPSGYPAATPIRVVGFVHYDSGTAAASRLVSMNPDGIAVAVECGEMFSFIADTSLTLNNATGSTIRVQIASYALA